MQTFFADFHYWHWLIIGFILVTLEMVVPGVFCLWIGLGAIFTGLIAFTFPSMALAWQGVIFALLAVACTYLGRKMMGKAEPAPQYANLNQRANQYIGNFYNVTTAISNGKGKVKVGDGEWSVKAAVDIEAGAKIKVIAVEGTELIVEKSE